MLWAYVFTGAVGFLLGVRFNVLALMLASLLVVLATPAFWGFASLALWEVLIAAFVALAVLQGSYLAGLAATYLVVRKSPRDPASEAPEWRRRKDEARSPQAVS